MNRNPKSEKQTAATPPCMLAWHVVERGGKSFWTRIGAVWPHGDQDGFTLDLDLMPIGTGRIVLRSRAQEEDAPAE